MDDGCTEAGRGESGDRLLTKEENQRRIRRSGGILGCMIGRHVSKDTVRSRAKVGHTASRRGGAGLCALDAANPTSDVDDWMIKYKGEGVKVGKDKGRTIGREKKCSIFDI
jgi:hypothetical protein